MTKTNEFALLEADTPNGPRINLDGAKGDRIMMDTDWDLMTEEAVCAFLKGSRTDVHELVSEGVLHTLSLAGQTYYYGEEVGNVREEFRRAVRRAEAA